MDLQVPDFLCDRTLERSIQTNITNSSLMTGAQEVYCRNLSLLQLDLINGQLLQDASLLKGLAALLQHRAVSSPGFTGPLET